MFNNKFSNRNPDPYLNDITVNMNDFCVKIKHDLMLFILQSHIVFDPKVLNENIKK